MFNASPVAFSTALLYIGVFECAAPTLPNVVPSIFIVWKCFLSLSRSLPCYQYYEYCLGLGNNGVRAGGIIIQIAIVANLSGLRLSRAL